MGDRQGAVPRTRRLINGSAVQEITSLSRSTIWRLVRTGEFPAAIVLTAGRKAWDADAVERWIAGKTVRGADD
jgi:prophage regulatory protein